MLNKSETKRVPCEILKNRSTFFPKNIQKVKIVIKQEDWNVILRTKIKYQSNKRSIMKKKFIKICKSKTINV